MTVAEFAERVTGNLPYTPTGQQEKLIAALSRFCSRNASPRSIFLLNGYAGTGKTSVTAALVNTLHQVGINSILLAPTGRAAKVFGNFAKRQAFTIHRKIYRQPGIGEASTIASVCENHHTDTFFIVDEASMISTQTDSGTNILEDLIQYVYTAEGCRLILLGDTAQLPPVGMSESPAMSIPVLHSYGLAVTKVTMTETVRQASQSGILYNATSIRRQMKSEQLSAPVLTVSPFDDVQVLDSESLEDALTTAYSSGETDDTILITRSNRRAVDFNNAIRRRIFDKEEELTKGELLLVAKNNYFFTSKGKNKLDFIANGDIARIEQVYGTEWAYGLRFADLKISLIDRNITLDVKVILNSLTSDSPALQQDKYQKLANDIIDDNNKFDPLTPYGIRLKMLKQDPHFNALQIKYAYAVTCHKAQGGQWKNVFIDMGYIPPEAYTNIDLFRWLYTAITRATTKVFFIAPTVEIK